MASFFGSGLRAAARQMPPAALRAFGRPAALFFHGVARHIRDPRIQINQHALEEFRHIARTLKENFDVLPLAALGDVMKHPDKHTKAVFLMSDDGYADTTLAADILEDLGLPWTLFLSTQHIDTGEWNPLTLARLFLFYAPEGRYAFDNFEIELRGEREAIASHAIARLRAGEAEAAKPVFAAMRKVLMEARLGHLFEDFSSEDFLTWNQVGELAARGVEIGAHAHWHWPMSAAQTKEHLREQALLPKQIIGEKLGVCRYFAYPFGNTPDISRQAREAVREAGYEGAFTTLSGTLDGTQDRWLLPRYGIALHEANIASVVPILRAGNPRLRNWQRDLMG
ncbi:MAG: polysaccharide deacetylase family protein [Rhizomicrobium sp.]